MSSSDIAVSVRGLSKSYTIAHNAQQHTTAAEALVSRLRSPFHKADKETFWALKDVEFDIKKGDVVGIIGRNGAGKSTLLKILSRITEPTTGRIALYGRVGSLLEVGTGFHPELTGRENIYLNGAILGMSKREIAKQFDAIVDFSGTEQFLDTPVKRYSSGMYVRLAFAVAAHLNPEILIVDEVLAVGDAEFQKKCLGKMEEVGAQGRTVLFVSHSMPMILRMCKRAILLDKGSVIVNGKPDSVAAHYVHSGAHLAERVFPSDSSAPGDDIARLRAVRVRNSQDCSVDAVDIRETFYVDVEYWNQTGAAGLTTILHFVNEEGTTLFSTNDFNNRAWFQSPRQVGLVRATCCIPGNFLAEGRIFLLVAIGRYNPNVIHALVRDVVSFQIVDQTDGDGVRGVASSDWPGVMRPMLDWEIEHVSETAAEGV